MKKNKETQKIFQNFFLGVSSCVYCVLALLFLLCFESGAFEVLKHLLILEQTVPLIPASMLMPSQSYSYALLEQR